MSDFSQRLLKAAKSAPPAPSARGSTYRDFTPAIEALVEKGYTDAAITDWILRQTSKTPPPSKSTPWTRMYAAVRRITKNIR